MSHPNFPQSRYAYRHDNLHTNPLAGDEMYRGIFQNHGYVLPDYVDSENGVLDGFAGNYVSGMGSDEATTSCDALKVVLRNALTKVHEANVGSHPILASVPVSMIWSLVEPFVMKELGTLAEKAGGSTADLSNWLFAKVMREIGSNVALKGIVSGFKFLFDGIAGTFINDVKAAGIDLQTCSGMRADSPANIQIPMEVIDGPNGPTIPMKVDYSKMLVAKPNTLTASVFKTSQTVVAEAAQAAKMKTALLIAAVGAAAFFFLRK